MHRASGQALCFNVAVICAQHIGVCDNIAAKTSEELYAKVKRIVPATSALIIPDPTLPGQMMLESVAAWEKVPEFSWWEIFGILGVPPPKGVKAPKGWSELIEV